MALNNLFENILKKNLIHEKYKNNVLFETKNEESIIDFFYHEENDTITILTKKNRNFFISPQYLHFFDVKKNIYIKIFFAYNKYYRILDYMKIKDIIYFLCIDASNNYYICYNENLEYNDNIFCEIRLPENQKIGIIFLFEKNGILRLAVKEDVYHNTHNKFIYYYILHEGKINLLEKKKLKKIVYIEKSNSKFFFEYEKSIEVMDSKGNKNMYMNKSEIPNFISVNQDELHYAKKFTKWLENKDLDDERASEKNNILNKINYFKKYKNYFYLHITKDLNCGQNEKILYFKNWAPEKNKYYKNKTKKYKIFYLVCIFKNKKMNMKKILKILYNL